MCFYSDVCVLHTSHRTANQYSYTKTVATINGGHRAIVSDHLEAHSWRYVSRSQKTCHLHIRHRPFCGCSAKWKQSHSEHGVLGWFLQKEVAEYHLHTQTHTHTAAFMYKRPLLTIAYRECVDSERNLSWKDFVLHWKCLIFYKAQLIHFMLVIPIDFFW